MFLIFEALHHFQNNYFRTLNQKEACVSCILLPVDSPSFFHCVSVFALTVASQSSSHRAVTARTGPSPALIRYYPCSVAISNNTVQVGIH